MWKRIRIWLWAWLTPLVNLVKNLFLPNSFIVAYRAEASLEEAKKRIQQYQKTNDGLLKQHKVRGIQMALLEGSLRAVIAAHPRNCVYIPMEDVRDALKRWRMLDTKQKDDDGSIRFQVREQKEWKKDHVRKPVDDAGEDRGVGPSPVDIVGV